MASTARSPLHQASTAEHSDESEDELEAPVDRTELVEIDVTTLNPLSPEVISKQATINIGQ